MQRRGTVGLIVAFSLFGQAAALAVERSRKTARGASPFF